MSRTTDAATVVISMVRRDPTLTNEATDSGTDTSTKREPIGAAEVTHSIQTAWADVHRALADCRGEPDIDPSVVEAAKVTRVDGKGEPVTHVAAMAASLLIALLECDHPHRAHIDVFRPNNEGIRLMWEADIGVVTVDFGPDGSVSALGPKFHRAWAASVASDVHGALSEFDALPCDVTP